MSFSQKIYYNDKPIVLATDSAQYILANPEAKKHITFTGASAQNYKQAVKELEKPEVSGVIISDASEKELWKQLHALYKPIDAAGGVVFNEEHAILMIFRRGKWDLPKGKLDKGEKIDACALREVSEETGLQQLALDGKICDTYHIYSQYGDHLLKRTAWYRMKGSVSDKLMPQKEENILEARWVAENEIVPFVSRSYEAIREVLRLAGITW